MSLTIPSDSICGGGITRSYKKNAFHKIYQFKITIELLDKQYNKDHIFYVTKLRDLFNQLDFLEGDTEYQILYDCILLSNYISELLENNLFEYHVKLLLDRFKIIDPLLKSFKYTIKEEKDGISYEMILQKIKSYIEKNNISLEMTKSIPNSDKYKNNFYEFMEKIKVKELPKDISLISVCGVIRYNLKNYLKIVDHLIEYISELEEFYIELSKKIYALKK